MFIKKLQSTGFIILFLNLLAVIIGASNLITFNWDIYKGFAVATALGYILFWLTLTRISNKFKHIIKLDVEANKKQSIKPTKEFIDPWAGMKLCNRHVLSKELKMLISVSELQSKEGDAYSAAFLAWIYEYGPLEIKDYEKSHLMYRQAALLGHEEALSRYVIRERMSAQNEIMTPEQKSARIQNISDAINKAVKEVKNKNEQE